jgi:chromate transport protein ChrA
LAKAEASAGMKDIAGGLATLGAGLAFIIPALTLFGMSVASLLTSEAELAPWIASAVTGIAFTIVGVVLIQFGRKSAASSHVSMSTTADNMKQDIQALKESVQ